MCVTVDSYSDTKSNGWHCRIARGLGVIYITIFNQDFSHTSRNIKC